jgi:hypothetical protein
VTSTWQPSAAALVADLQRIFAFRLRSVVAYGPQIDGSGDAPLTCLALVDSLGIDDLEGCARMAHRWKRHGLAIPLVLPSHEFRRSLDAFPIEYSEILRAHARVFGDDPFDGISIAREDLRRACETQVKSHLVHLREGFIESGGRPKEIADLVSTSAPAFAALLRSMARLGGEAPQGRAEAGGGGGPPPPPPPPGGGPPTVVADILSLEHGTNPATIDAAKLFPSYLEAVEQLASAVDDWRA